MRKAVSILQHTAHAARHAPLERVADAAKNATEARVGLSTASDSAPENVRNANRDSEYTALPRDK